VLATTLAESASWRQLRQLGRHNGNSLRPHGCRYEKLHRTGKEMRPLQSLMILTERRRPVRRAISPDQSFISTSRLLRDPGYRAVCDGLRAVAVGLVVFDHAGLMFPGGFVGVDVFFVISGFLITRLILADDQAGSMTLREFWMRRIRRILPAAAVTVGVTL